MGLSELDRVFNEESLDQLYNIFLFSALVFTLSWELANSDGAVDRGLLLDQPFFEENFQPLDPLSIRIYPRLLEPTVWKVFSFLHEESIERAIG